MVMQEGGRDIAGLLALDTFLDDGRLALRPGHDDYLFRLADGLDPHGDGTLGHILNPPKGVGRILPGQSVQVDQPCDALDG